MMPGTNPGVIVVGGGLSSIDEIHDFLPGLKVNNLPGRVTMPPIPKAKFGYYSVVGGVAVVGVQI